MSSDFFPKKKNKKTDEVERPRAFTMGLSGLLAVFVLFLIFSLAPKSRPPVPAATVQSPASTTSAPLAEIAPRGSLATITSGSKSYTLRCTDIGLFPRISVAPSAIIKVHVKATPGEPVEELALDGGALASNKLAEDQRADANGNLNFTFQAANTPGSSRVALFRFGRREIFDFWVDNSLSNQ